MTRHGEISRVGRMPKTGRRHRGYRVVFHGESETLARAFPDLKAEFGEGNTALIGTIRDQAELLGMLERADSLGFELVSLNPIDSVSREVEP